MPSGRHWLDSSHLHIVEVLPKLLNLLTRGQEWGTSHCRMCAQRCTLPSHLPLPISVLHLYCADLCDHLDKTTVQKDKPEVREVSTEEGR